MVHGDKNRNWCRLRLKDLPGIRTPAPSLMYMTQWVQMQRGKNHILLRGLGGKCSSNHVWSQ